MNDEYIPSEYEGVSFKRVKVEEKSQDVGPYRPRNYKPPAEFDGLNSEKFDIDFTIKVLEKISVMIDRHLLDPQNLQFTLKIGVRDMLQFLRFEKSIRGL